MARTAKNKHLQLPPANDGTQFFKNIYYFYVTSGMDKGEFLKKSGINSINMWRRYAQGAQPRGSTLKSFTDALNEIIAARPSLRALLPDGITDPVLLLDCDLAGRLSEGKPPAPLINENSFTPAACISKFTGIYMVYYPNTAESDVADFRLSYGVMAVTEDANKNDPRLTCQGFFNISDYTRATECFRELSSATATKLPSVLLSLKTGPLTAERYYEGELTLGETFFWLTMHATNHTEFLSVSFDMDVKTLYLNPDKLFDGTRGIALSQAAGSRDLHSVSFPLIIAKHALKEHENISQIRYYLNFSHKAPDESAIERVSDKILSALVTLDALPEDGEHLKRIYLTDVLKSTVDDQTLYVSARQAVLDRLVTGSCYEHLLKRRNHGV